MQSCPNCAKELDDRDVLCAFCGHTVQNGTKPSEALAPIAVRQPTATATGSARATNTSANVVLAAAVLGGIAVLGFLARSPRSEGNPNAAIASATPETATPAAVPATLTAQEPTTAPRWRRTRQSQWATDGSRTIGFEAAALRDVPVYMDRVRPIIAARCISRQIQVFVVLGSATSIERGSETHTVQISLDGEPGVEQQWLDSSDRQALFAPDGESLATRLAAARTLRFGFSPFNAPAATAEFDVHGFDEPLAAMAKTCGAASKLAGQSTRR